MLARTFETATTEQSPVEEGEAVVEDEEEATGVATEVVARQEVSLDREGQAQTTQEPPSQPSHRGNNEETPVGGRLARFGEK